LFEFWTPHIKNLSMIGYHSKKFFNLEIKINLRLEIQIFLISFHQVRFWTENIFSHFGNEILKWEYFFSLPKWDLQKIFSLRLFRSEIFEISSRCEITWTSLISTNFLFEFFQTFGTSRFVEAFTRYLLWLRKPKLLLGAIFSYAIINLADTIFRLLHKTTIEQQFNSKMITFIIYE